MPIVYLKNEQGDFVPIPILHGGDGKSAYEQAVEGGYKGSEEEFIALLNGLTDKEDASRYISKGSYEGIGIGSKTIPIRKTTQMVLVYGMNGNEPYTIGVLVRGVHRTHCDIGPSVSDNTFCGVGWDDVAVTVFDSLERPLYAWNESGVTYNYVLIG